MALCVSTAAGVASLAASVFSLSWTHSVERVEWQEDWRIDGDRLVLVEARVKGSGAGMEPGEHAVLDAGWWSWRPDLPPQAELRLATSSAVAGWRLCAGDSCRHLGPVEHGAETIVLTACPPPT